MLGEILNNRILNLMIGIKFLLLGLLFNRYIDTFLEIFLNSDGSKLLFIIISETLFALLCSLIISINKVSAPPVFRLRIQCTMFIFLLIK